MRKNVFNTLMAMTALLVSSVAHAAPGQPVGSRNQTSSWASRVGNDFASADVSMNSMASFAHDGVQPNMTSAVASFAWSSPSARLFGQRIPFWNVNTTGSFTRARNGGAATRATATGNIEFGGTSYYTCSLTSTQLGVIAGCEKTRALNRTYAQGEMTYLIAGAIPVTVGGRINGNLSAQLIGTGTTNSYSNAPATTHDRTLASMFATGAVTGTAFVRVGIGGVFGVEGGMTLSLLQVNGSGPTAQASRNKCTLGQNCFVDNRVQYILTSSVGGGSLTTLDGNIWVEGCIITNPVVPIPYCQRGNVGTWRGIRLANWRLDPKSHVEHFAGIY